MAAGSLSLVAPALVTPQALPGRGHAHLLQAPHIPGFRVVSSSWVWLDAGSLSNRVGGDRQGRATGPLAGSTRKVPVVMGTAMGSAVRKGLC